MLIKRGGSKFLKGGTTLKKKIYIYITNKKILFFFFGPGVAQISFFFRPGGPGPLLGSSLIVSDFSRILHVQLEI